MVDCAQSVNPLLYTLYNFITIRERLNTTLVQKVVHFVLLWLKTLGSRQVLLNRLLLRCVWCCAVCFVAACCFRGLLLRRLLLRRLCCWDVLTAVFFPLAGCHVRTRGAKLTGRVFVRLQFSLLLSRRPIKKVGTGNRFSQAYVNLRRDGVPFRGAGGGSGSGAFSSHGGSSMGGFGGGGASAGMGSGGGAFASSSSRGARASATSRGLQPGDEGYDEEADLAAAIMASSLSAAGGGGGGGGGQGGGRPADLSAAAGEGTRES